MNGALLADAFGHHVWATLEVIDACLALDAEQLDTAVPGIYGSILDTLRHTVGADGWYLYVLTREPEHRLEDEAGLGLAELRAAMVRNGAAWTRLLAGDLDPDVFVERPNTDEGRRVRAAVGIRLAQALHHGTDHRSQVCTALTTLGIEPPAVDVWDYGATVGRVVETSA